jgi:hypothetical protein
MILFPEVYDIQEDISEENKDFFKNNNLIK